MPSGNCGGATKGGKHRLDQLRPGSQNGVQNWANLHLFHAVKKPELDGDSVFPNAEGDVGTCRAGVGLRWAFEASWELIPSRIWGGTPKGGHLGPLQEASFMLKKSQN